jgi:16S rRNA (guanine1207-N2)-methyltransferase
MRTTSPMHASQSEYFTWRTRRVSVEGRDYAVATKPGLVSHGGDDVAGRLLAERVRIAPGDTVVQLNCGSGLFGAVASLGQSATRVLLTDRSIVSVDAARRTMAENRADNAPVFLGHGAAPLPSDVRADVVAIRIPTEKAALLQLLADAFELLRVGGQCCLAGATNEGIKSAATILARIFGNLTVIGTDSGHRAVMAVKRAALPSDAEVFTSPSLGHDVFRDMPATLANVPLHLFSKPGLFSWDHVDEATTILANVMEARDASDVLDLGCGTGALGLLAAHQHAAARVTLLDVDSEAVRCTQRAIDTMGLTRCRTLCSDVAQAVHAESFDLVLTNPPFHVGKSTELGVPVQFIRDAWRVLRPGGRLALVANRTLPYERLITETFGNLSTLHDGVRFKVLGARR